MGATTSPVIDAAVRVARASRIIEVALKRHIMQHLGCANCGAQAGEPCKHDYGCIDTDRTVR